MAPDLTLPSNRLVVLRALVFGLAAAASVVLAAAVAVLVAHPVDLFWHDRMPGLLGLMLLMLAAEHASIKVPGHAARISVSELFAFLTAFHLGPWAAAVALAVDGAYVSYRQTRPTLLRTTFNIAEPVLSIAGACAAARLVPDPFLTARAGAEFIGSLPALLVTYFLLNTWLTACAVSLESGVSPLSVWSSHALYTGANYVAAGAVAGLTVDPVDGIDIRVVGIVGPLGLLSYLVLRNAARQMDQVQRHIAELDERYLATIEALAIAVDVKDDVTHGHVRRVQVYSVAVARALGVTDAGLLKALDTAGLLHDVGKITVPDRVLQKPGKLSPAEFETMKRHADTGARIVEQVRFPYPVAPIVRHHHERWDGRGYPDGLAGEQIPLGARIVAVVDCFDAVTSDRPYRRRLSDDEAAALLVDGRGAHFDPAVVDVFVPLIPMLRNLAAPAAVDVFGLMHSRPLPDFRVQESEAMVTASLFVQHAPATMHTLRRMRPGAELACYALDGVADMLLPAWITPSLHDARVVTPLPLGERLSGWVGGHRQTVANTDPSLDLGEGEATRHLRQAVSLPVFRNGSIAGVFTVYAPGEERFSDRDVAALWHLSQQMMQPAASPLGPTRIEHLPAVWFDEMPLVVDGDTGAA